MKFEIEIPDDWIKTGKEWKSSQVMTCFQCPYKTPNAGMFVAHMFSVHESKEKEEQSLILDK